MFSQKSDLKLADLIEGVIRQAEPRERIALEFEECRIEVISNSRALLEKLAYYFKDFLRPLAETHITVHAIEAQASRFGLSYTIKPPDPGKSKIKEEFAEFSDGRVIRKRLTDMCFLFSGNFHLAYGPCVKNDNQVINFINNRYIQWCLQRKFLLCHSAAIAKDDYGIAIAGFSGMGKSTLSLEIMARGLDFISNDRVLIRRDDERVEMRGVAKLPRINPGTILNNPALYQVMPEEDRELISGLSTSELWELEQKYDAFIDQCFGPGRYRLGAEMKGLFILNWQRNESETQISQVDISSRVDLLEAFMKGVGLFFDEDTAPDFDPTVDSYVEALRGIPVFEVSGGVNFECAADHCVQFLKSGAKG